MLRLTICERDSPVDSKLRTLLRLGSGLVVWPGSGALRSRLRNQCTPRLYSYLPLTNRLFLNVLSSEIDEIDSYGATMFASVTRTDDGGTTVAIPSRNGSGYEGLLMTSSYSRVPSSRFWVSTRK